jgi:hypothetical protein
MNCISKCHYQANHGLVLLTLLVFKLNTDIEQVTKKTGNFKKFGIFVEMINAIGSDDTVSVDILTADDLKNLNNRTPVLMFPDKIYFIVTYAVAFDRVHYPLPLSLCLSPNVKYDRLLAEHENVLSKLKNVEQFDLGLA